MRRRTTRCLALMIAACVAVPASPALASIPHPDVVGVDPVNYTPHVVDTNSGRRPHVDDLDQLGSTIYAGGLFDRVENSSRTTTYTRHNLMAFDARTGALRQTFTPSFDDNVWAVETAPGAVYVGGSFKTVNGSQRAALAKLDPVTGALDTRFQPRFTGGRVNEVRLIDGRLIVGGASGRKLMTLDPATGRNTGWIDLAIHDKIPGSWGGVAVYDFAVNSAGTKLVATGNFQTVDGEARTRFFMADLGPAGATLSRYYYQPFAKPCTSTHPRRIAYLQGVDFSPDGSYFVVAATGQIPRAGDIGVTVCDAAARFNVNDSAKPVWINYTGGDSVWAVAATGPAVYAQGHFKWLDNPNGYASRCPEGEPCAWRRGLGAIDPVTGKALPWKPDKPAQLGGKEFLATSEGLWVPSDSLKLHREYHRGIAFLPLP